MSEFNQDNNPFTCTLRQKRTLGKYLLGFTNLSQTFEESTFEMVYLNENTRIEHQNGEIVVNRNDFESVNFMRGAIVILEKDVPRPRKTKCQQIIDYVEEEIFHRTNFGRKRLEHGDLLKVMGGELIFENFDLIEDESDNYEEMARFLYYNLQNNDLNIQEQNEENFHVQEQNDDRRVTFLPQNITPKGYTLKINYQVVPAVAGTNKYDTSYYHGGYSYEIIDNFNINITRSDNIATTYSVRISNTRGPTLKYGTQVYTLDAKTGTTYTTKCTSLYYYASRAYYRDGFTIRIYNSDRSILFWELKRGYRNSGYINQSYGDSKSLNLPYDFSLKTSSKSF